MVEKLVTLLEMTDPDELRAARPVHGFQLVHINDPNDADVRRLRAIYAVIATTHRWASVWCPAQDWQPNPHQSHWIAMIDGVDVGWAALEGPGDHGVRIAAFGVRPEFVGRGYGGAFLTSVVHRAWEHVRMAGSAPAQQRVWLRTSSWDHPHAIANYQARGFRVNALQLQHLVAGEVRRVTTVDSPPLLLVRPAVPDDNEAMVRLLSHLCYDLTPAGAHRRLAALTPSVDAIIAVVARQPDAAVVGMISAHVVPLFAEVDAAFSTITALVVSHDARKRGIGRMLVGYVEYVSQLSGARLLETSYRRPQERENLHGFHTAMGFRQSASCTAHYWKSLGSRGDLLLARRNLQRK